MQTFRFRLARVLAWYERQYRLGEDRVRESAEAVARFADQIRQAEEARASAERDLHSSGSFGSGDLAALARFQDRSRREVHSLGLRRREAEVLLTQRRAELLAARRRIELLEKLRARRLGEYNAENSQELDELAADAFRSASHRARG